MSSLLVGIDVGGVKKGFHLAGFVEDSNAIAWLAHASSAVKAASILEELGDIRCIAIDAPCRAQILGPKTRLAERQISLAGGRIQWTRRAPLPPQEWMVNGESLWRELETRFPLVRLIETFPTMATRNLANSPISVPLHLLAPFASKREWKDFVDAAICADVARRFVESRAIEAGLDVITGERDELGPIHY